MGALHPQSPGRENNAPGKQLVSWNRSETPKQEAEQRGCGEQAFLPWREQRAFDTFLPENVEVLPGSVVVLCLSCCVIEIHG